MTNVISFRLGKEQIERIDQEAAKAGVSRSEYLKSKVENKKKTPHNLAGLCRMSEALQEMKTRLEDAEMDREFIKMVGMLEREVVELWKL